MIQRLFEDDCPDDCPDDGQMFSGADRGLGQMGTTDRIGLCFAARSAPSGIECLDAFATNANLVFDFENLAEF